MSIVAFLTSDLLFQSRVASVAKNAGVQLFADRTPEKLIAKLVDGQSVQLIIFDLILETGDLVEALNSVKAHCPAARSVAYGPHVHEARLQRAVEAGFDQVLTRGQFDHQMVSLIQMDSN